MCSILIDPAVKQLVIAFHKHAPLASFFPHILGPTPASFSVYGLKTSADCYRINEAIGHRTAGKKNTELTLQGLHVASGTTQNPHRVRRVKKLKGEENRETTI